MILSQYRQLVVRDHTNIKTVQNSCRYWEKEIYEIYENNEIYEIYENYEIYEIYENYEIYEIYENYEIFNKKVRK